MGKKKAENTGSVRDKFIKKFGDEIFQSPDSIVDKQNKIIRITPRIDFLLSGGLSQSALVLINGRPKLGKTSCALKIGAACQREENNTEWGPRKIIYYDIENRLKSRDLRGVNGLILDKNRFEVIRSSPGNILDAETFLELGDNLIKEEMGGVHIFDSFSALCSSQEAMSSFEDRIRHDVPMLLARFCRRLAQVISVNDSIVIGITHTISNTSGKGYKTTSEASGVKLQYAADIKLVAQMQTPFMVNDKQVGQEVKFKCECSSLGPPGRVGDVLLRYGFGLDEFHDLVEFGVDLGIIKKAGSYYKINDNTVQGREAIRNYLAENVDVAQEIQKQVEELYSPIYQ